jgi:hypothetical protein
MRTVQEVTMVGCGRCFVVHRPFLPTNTRLSQTSTPKHIVFAIHGSAILGIVAFTPGAI